MIKVSILGVSPINCEVLDGRDRHYPATVWQRGAAGCKSVASQDPRRRLIGKIKVYSLMQSTMRTGLWVFTLSFWKRTITQMKPVYCDLGSCYLNSKPGYPSP